MSLFSGENPALGINATVNGDKIIAIDHINIPLSTASTTQVFYLCPPKLTDKFILKSAQVIYTTASASGTVTIEYLTGTQAPGGGTVLLATPLLLSSTVNTILNAVPSVNKVANPGDRFGIIIAGTLTGLAGAFMQIAVARY